MFIHYRQMPDIVREMAQAMLAPSNSIPPKNHESHATPAHRRVNFVVFVVYFSCVFVLRVAYFPANPVNSTIHKLRLPAPPLLGPVAQFRRSRHIQLAAHARAVVMHRLRRDPQPLRNLAGGTLLQIQHQ